MKTLTIIIITMGIISRLFGITDPQERKEKIEELEAKVPSAEAMSRKAQSMRFLKEKGIPTIEHLPVIEDSLAAKVRSTKEIAERLIGCTISAVGGETGDKDLMKELVADFEADNLLTAEEKRFLASGIESQHERVQFSWRYERSWVLLWALGHIESLDYPPAICDVPRLAGFLKGKSVAELVEGANPRTKKEILDEADLIYRLHWAVTEERVNGSFELSENIERGVVQERHAALNWLIGYMGQSWDEITTDT